MDKVRAEAFALIHERTRNGVPLKEIEVGAHSVGDDQARRAAMYSSSQGVRPSLAVDDVQIRMTPSGATSSSNRLSVASRSIQCSARPMVTASVSAVR